MKTKAFVLCLILALLPFTIMAEVIEGNGKLVTKELSIHPFDAIRIDMSVTNNNDNWKKLFKQASQTAKVNFSYQATGKTSLKITIDENIYPSLTVKVDDGQLLIKTKEGTQIRPTRFDIVGTSESLKKVDVSGNTTLSINSDLNGEQFTANVSTGASLKSENALTFVDCDIDASTGCEVELKQLNCDNLSASASTGCDVKLGGKADIAHLAASTGSGIKASNLTVTKAQCDSSTGSGISVHVVKELDASASLGSDIIYSGDPATDISTSLGGSVHK